jgi:hypothetical protein
LEFLSLSFAAISRIVENMAEGSNGNGWYAFRYVVCFALGMIVMALFLIALRRPEPTRAASVGTTSQSRRNNDAASSALPLTFPRPSSFTAKMPPRVSPGTNFDLPPVESAPVPLVQPVTFVETAPPLVAAIDQPVLLAPPANVASDANTIGRLSGRVFLKGIPPPEKPLPFDPQCGKLNPPQKTTRMYVLGKDQSLGDVFIYIKEGLDRTNFAIPKEALVLSARGCFYQPYISGAQRGQKLVLRNLDPVIHNAHLTHEEGKFPDRNISLIPRQRSSILTLDHPSVFLRVKCDVHPWEFAYVGVVEHPFFAVSDADGRFAIDRLPPGNYLVEARHRKAGSQFQRVTITPDSGAEIEFTFEVPEAKQASR